MLRVVVFWCLIFAGFQAGSVELDAPFNSIDSGTFLLSEWNGLPVLVVNIASQCAFTRQYRGLQNLYDRYRERGLIVLAVPSDDFRQELATSHGVKDFCDLQDRVDLLMTGITSIKGRSAHPVFQSLSEEEGFTLHRNFNKVLIGPDGSVVETYESTVDPLSTSINREIEALLE